MVTTLRKVAAAAGVHPSTASRALNEKTRHLVNAEVAARIIAVAEELGYRPDVAAAALRSGRSRLIGALVPGIGNPVFAPILAGAADVLARDRMGLLAADPGQDRARALDLVQELVARRVDGLLLATTLSLPDAALDLALERDIPVVLINRGAPGVASVVPDNWAGMGVAVRHLHALGHRRIGYVGGFNAQAATNPRRDAFLFSMAELGLPPAGVEMSNDFDRASGRAGAQVVLTRTPRPTAVVCGNDLIAVGAYDAARALGLSVPGDLSVTGFNDLPLMDMLDPPMTTLRVDYRALGERAATRLLALVEARLGDVEAVDHALESLPCDLILRGSTAPPGD